MNPSKGMFIDVKSKPNTFIFNENIRVRLSPD